MTSNQKWLVLIVIFVIGGLFLLNNIEKKLHLTIIVEPNLTAEINWITEDNLWFGGTYTDSDGDGEITVKLPQDTSRITIGRDIRRKTNITVITSASNQILANDTPASCPIVITQDTSELLNICSLPIADFNNNIGLAEFSSKDATVFFNETQTARLASIEALDSNLVENLPKYNGEDVFIGYDELTSKWSVFSR